jgi:uncharacterized protein (TIGR04255 family)
VEGIAPIQEQLEPLFPYMTESKFQQIQLHIGPGAPPAAAANSGRIWRFTGDAGWVLLVSPSRATLAVGAEYEHFGDFVDRFREVLFSLAAAGVNRCDRLGLKYLDVAPIPDDDTGAWREWFRPELTGWATTNIVSDDTKIFTSFSQTQLSTPAIGELAGAPADIVALIRHGVFPAGSVPPTITPGQPLQSSAFLLDTDMFVAAEQPFEVERLVKQVTAFHGELDKFFHWSLTDDGAAYFGLEEVNA